MLSYYKYNGVATLVGNRFEKALVQRRVIDLKTARSAAHDHGLFYADMSIFPELRLHSLAVLEMSCRYALFALTKRESFVATDVSLTLDAGRMSSVDKERLISLLLEEETASLSSQSSADASDGARRMLFQRVAKRPPVFAAIEGRNLAKVRSMISSSSSVNRLRDPGSKSSPLMLCASMCESSTDVEIASLLLQSSAAGDCNHQNAAGDTALIMVMKSAPSKDSLALLRLLVGQPGVDLSVTNVLGSNVFHIAADKGYTMLFHGGNLPNSAFTFNGARESPVYLAARSGHLDILAILVTDPRVQQNVMNNTSLSYSAMHIAVLQKQPAALALLLNSPMTASAMNAVNKDQYTPLYLAIETVGEECKSLLFERGADPRIGQLHRLAPQLFRSTFVPAYLTWNVAQSLKTLDLSRCNLDTVPPALLKIRGLRSLNLSRNRLEVIPRTIVDTGEELEELYLSDNSLRAVPYELMNLKKLCLLRLDGNLQIPVDLAPLMLAVIAKAVSLDLSNLHLHCVSLDVLNQCQQLEQIALNENVLTNVDFLASLVKLKSLWIHDNRLEALPPTPAVELLKISGNRLRDLTGIESFPNLRELWVENNLLTRLSLAQLSPTMHRLWLDGNEITKLEPPVDSSTLTMECLSLKNNQIREIPTVFVPSLKRLWMDGNLIEQLPTSFGMEMTKLRTLSLSGNPLRSFPAQISNLVSLSELALNDCLLEEVDVSIGNLLALKKLSLRGNRLKYLPQTMGHLTKLTNLDVSDNSDLSSPPPETVKGGTAAIVGFLHDLIADSKPSYRMKLMVVGQEAVGKTSLLRCITAKQRKPSFFGTKRSASKAPLSTDGIDIEQWDRRVKLASGEGIKVNFRAWDFAGQEVYYTTHAFFLSNRSIYMVVWSLARPDDLQRVTYWLHSIQSRAPKAPIMLVGTHAETHSPQALEELETATLLKHRSKFPNLNIVGFTAFSATNSLNLKPLLESLDETALRQPFMGEPLPTLYLTLEQAVAAERKRVPPVMTWEEFKKLGVGCGVLREEELLRAVQLLHEMGSLFFFKPVDKAKFARLTLVVLDPQWLTKVMAQVITTKSSFVRNGILDHKNVAFMWKPPDYPESLHASLLDLLQAFDVMFRMDGVTEVNQGKSLVPAMLPFRSSAEELLKSSRIKEYGVTLGRIFEFEFLPAGFFSRLTVRLLHMTKSEEVWADHVVISSEESIARISSVGMTISVTVQGHSYNESLLKLLKITVSNLESLAEEWFQIRATTKVPCVHCIQQNNAKPPHLFDLQECEQAVSHGLAYVSCCGQFPVSLVALCPDVIVSTDLPVVQWEVLGDQTRIGEGTFAYVYRATLDDRVVAVKRLIDETDYRELRREAANLMSLKHRNVVELLGVCYKPAALITEFMGRGSLFDYLQDASVSITWSQRLSFARDIAAGMHFLHTTTPPIIHRDCKSANVLLHDDLTCKISDFGTVTMIAPFTTGRVVTNPRWQAPEVLLNLPYGSPADVYAFGVVIWELCTREIPFTDKPSYAWAHNVEDDVCRGFRPPVRDSFPAIFSSLMQECWNQKPEERPVFTQIVKSLEVDGDFANDNVEETAPIELRSAQVILSPRNLA